MEGAEKLCRGSWVEAVDGRCSDGMQSKNKGLPCKSNTDCPTSRTGVYATCRCGFNTNGTKYCDAEGGDEEWLTARTAVTIALMISIVQRLYGGNEGMP